MTWYNRAGVEHTDEHIKGFFGDYRWLSNYHPTPVHYEGGIYPSSENAYQAAKTTYADEREAFEIATPNQAKKMGRALHIREDWDLIKLEVMYEILKDKFTRNKVLKQALLDTGDRILEETNWWNDKYWGVCNGVGDNHLGHLLMQIRDELK